MFTAKMLITPFICVLLSRISLVHIIVDYDVAIGSNNSYLLRNNYNIYFYYYVVIFQTSLNFVTYRSIVTTTT